jgi:hypothetical protein
MSDIQEKKQFMNYLVSGIYTPFLSICFFSKIINSLMSSDPDFSIFVSKNEKLVSLGVIALTTSIGWQTHLYLTRKFNDKQLMESNVVAPLIVSSCATPVGFFHGLVKLPFTAFINAVDFVAAINFNRYDPEPSGFTQFFKKYLVF